MGEWLIKWEKRGRSGPVDDSFLWHCNRLYVMDNHRLALWCWWQHLKNNPYRWDFLHIDRHYDALWQEARPWSKHHNPQHRLDLSSFRQATFPESGVESKLYRWDAITSALKVLDGDKIDSWAFATAGEGAPLSIPESKLQTISPWDLPAHLRWMAGPTENTQPFIVDIDIDYFTHLDYDDRVGQVFSDQYIRELGAAINEGLSNNRFGVVTIALSPTTTGSWELAEELCYVLLEDHPCLPELQAGKP